jgi:hypothetical protein
MHAVEAGLGPKRAATSENDPPSLHTSLGGSLTQGRLRMGLPAAASSWLWRLRGRLLFRTAAPAACRRLGPPSRDYTQPHSRAPAPLRCQHRRRSTPDYTKTEHTPHKVCVPSWRASGAWLLDDQACNLKHRKASAPAPGVCGSAHRREADPILSISSCAVYMRLSCSHGQGAAVDSTTGGLS